VRIIVTGGTGNIGPAVVEHLVSRGFRVTVVGRRQCAELPGADYQRCDIGSFDDLAGAMRGHDAVVHLAAIGVPIARPGRDLFEANALGTFNVFEAAAKCGIGRVVSASSINALGYFFGDRSLPLRYVPVDEDHPTLATDAYSFSKQIVERIGRYFWGRDGISSASLRIPGVMRHRVVVSSEDPYRKHYSIAFVERLLGMPDGERRREIDRLQAAYDRYRTEHRADAAASGTWGRIDAGNSDYITAEELGFMVHQTNFFTYLDDLDCAQAVEKSITVDYQGSHTLFVNSTRNSLGLPLDRMAGLYPDEPPVRTHRPNDDTLISIDSARDLIGFEPEWAMKPLFDSSR
jgi:NAD(P)-dependent dehydrogenase (short-subunit alcohol dehydrogenase family)